MSKEEKEKDKKHEDKGRYHFPLMSKGETNMRSEIS
jgi:hypothetical protein